MHKFIVILLIGLLALTGYFLCSKPHSGVLDLRGAFEQSPDSENILVSRVIDGDTLLLENNVRVRLIGIDTPEIHDSAKLERDARRSGKDAARIKQMGGKSFEFTRRLVEGKRVKLEFDVEKADRYKRTLAYVYLTDGTFVNAKIVQEGYASLMTYPPNVKYAELFLKLYQEARQNKRGLWQAGDL